MKFIDEYRDPESANKLQALIAQTVKNDWTIMEICGGQTHSIMRYGIDQLLPPQITLVHGPGCPVCVTPIELIDKAVEIAADKNVIFCSFGDMLRVPGSQKDLLSVKAEGGDIRIVYSPMDALAIAAENPHKSVVFFAVGFETTAPANAMTVLEAYRRQIKNFFVLVSHVLVPPAIKAILSSEANMIKGFLAAGHVCAVMGYREYEAIAEKYRIPIVVTGFEPLDILEGIYRVLLQLEKGKYEVENQYRRSVRREGNIPAKQVMNEIFTVSDRKWRGIGEIADSGFRLSDKYRAFDAELRFGLSEKKVEESKECISGMILLGIKKPNECPAFASRCTPEHPLGATMVSSEGACSAYYRYRPRVGKGAAT